MKQIIQSLIPTSVLKKYRAYKTQKQINLYRGDDVFCPICNSKFRIFGPYGLGKRENAQCHNCGSLERHRLIWKYLSDKLNFFASNKKVRLLHFAPERVFYNLFSEMENIEYVPCDLFPEEYNFRGKVKVDKVDITNIPYQANSFDFILCNHVLEHIPDDKLAMDELFRVMKKGGSGIFQVPIDYNRIETYEDFSITKPKDREKAFGQRDHVRWYGQDYKKRLEDAGFIVTEDNYVHSFTPEELFRYGLMSSELIYYCQK